MAKIFAKQQFFLKSSASFNGQLEFGRNRCFDFALRLNVATPLAQDCHGVVFV